MKSLKTSLTTLSAFTIIGMGLIIGGCNKKKSYKMEDIGNTKNNTNELIAKPKGSISLSFPAGHSKSECSGQGLCQTIISGGGIYHLHVPCQASGKDCNWSFDLGFSTYDVNGSNPFDFSSAIGDYQGLEFMMPDRSIFIEELAIYINIPEQVLSKNTNGEFDFKNVYFSQNPVFLNL